MYEGDLCDRAVGCGAERRSLSFSRCSRLSALARNPHEIERNNVEDGRLVIEEALSAGVERIVYTSSVATLKLTDGAAATEDNALPGKARIGVYKRSKCLAAERLVLRPYLSAMDCRR